MDINFNFLQKKNNFERRGESGAAGDANIIDFSLNSFTKVTILSAGATAGTSAVPPGTQPSQSIDLGARVQHLS